MILSEANINKLQNLGLIIIPDESSLRISKKGKLIENINHHSNGLTVDLKLDKGNIVIWSWELSPGPGPGDFALHFKNESEALDFLESYFFGDNPHKDELKQHILDSRETYNSTELEQLFKLLLAKISKVFGNDEIQINHRGTYHKISIDAWNISRSKPEHPTITVDWGFLSNDLYELRRLLHTEKEFQSEDIQKLASVLMDLGVHLRNKNCG